MINEKERTVSKENYEISLKVYKLFKKYQNYETDIKNAEMRVKYNPDNLFKNRRKVIDKKIEANNISCEFPNDVKEYIASNCTSDIRKLEGAITRVFAYSIIMNGSEITLDLAIEALKDYFVKSIISKNKVDQVQQVVAAHYNITVEDLKSKKRNANISVPRQVAMYICRIVLEESLPKIGMEFGGKDHTTVMHSVDKIKKEITNDASFKNEIDKLISKIK